MPRDRFRVMQHGELRRVVPVEKDEGCAQRHGIERIDPRACGNDDPALVVGNIARGGDRRIEAPAAQRRGEGNARDRLWPVDPGDRPPLQLFIEPGRFAGLLKLGEPGMDLLKQVRFDDGPYRAVLAVIASHCLWCDGQRQRSGANRQSEEPHRIGLPTPSMRGPQIQPIAA